MLSKKKCIQAIKNWKETKRTYSKVKNLINPSSIFSFSQENCNWLNEKNNNSNFHAYIGDHKNQLILIVVPLNKYGNEIDLSAYLTLPLTTLSHELTLTETKIITTTNKTTLSKKLMIASSSEEVEFSIFNEPIITERASIADIQKWNSECMDWFYYECTYHNGKRIFKTFLVPFSDLIKDNEEYNEVKVLFGFKHITINQSPIPVLIFIASHTKTSDAKIIRLSASDNSTITNSRDWSQPCPPLCRKEEEFMLLS